MNRILTIAAVTLALSAWLGADIAEAKRMGGGRSVGAQRQMTPAPAPNTPNAAPSTPASPAQSAAPRAAAAAPAARLGHVALARPDRGHRRRPGPGRAVVALRPVRDVRELPPDRVGRGRPASCSCACCMRARRNPTAPAAVCRAPAPGRVEPHDARTTSPLRAGDGRRSAHCRAAASRSRPASRFPPGFDAGAFIEQAKASSASSRPPTTAAIATALAEVMTPEMYAEVSKDLAAARLARGHGGRRAWKPRSSTSPPRASSTG